MAMKLSHSDDGLDLNHDINVTPFIDVMLVLLIIFMVAAPLATVNVNVDLPVSTAQAQPQTEEPIVLSLGKDLSLSLGNDRIERAALAARLGERTKGNLNARIFLRADKVVNYGDLMGLMNELRASGYLKVALVGLEPGAAQP
ncbi:TonB system transport protein ExbD [Sphingomonas colocasiae]|uniref:Biopolymer transport protein ExbD n=1 Tax=Sphingomonas colocasiae TaxID=1848973 RepID=A0ABS7PRN6_9SPHN|nr:TonB system transport protein ExbD [Sphingomonas colocasiae]MBY8823335.1 TonB system transport protein ExbD [Sphingomonas colocasiae]MBY8823436.1 TonB system transport protein ExbD [Sphingomonas colocasiae]